MSRQEKEKNAKIKIKKETGLLGIEPSSLVSSTTQPRHNATVLLVDRGRELCKVICLLCHDPK